LRLRRRRCSCRSGSGVFQRRIPPCDVHGWRSGSLDKSRIQDEQRFIACRGHPGAIATIHPPTELSDGLKLSRLRLTRSVLPHGSRLLNRLMRQSPRLQSAFVRHRRQISLQLSEAEPRRKAWFSASGGRIAHASSTHSSRHGQVAFRVFPHVRTVTPVESHETTKPACPSLVKGLLSKAGGHRIPE
jgi:hypothetical protein